MTAYPLGTVLSADFVFFKHRGVVTGHDYDGRPLVTSSSRRRGQVVEESLDEFSRGRQVSAEPALDAHPAAVARNAHSGLGMRYDFLSFNCDHFVEWAKGREPVSRQLAFWGSAIGAAALLTFALRSK